jgi:hypothetical protein
MVIFSDFDISTPLKAASFGTQLVHLHWIGNSDNENNFRIERKSIYSDFVEIGNLDRDVTFFTDRGGNLYAGGTFSIAKKSLSTQILLTVMLIIENLRLRWKLLVKILR